jgi:hypothetical protein
MTATTTAERYFEVLPVRAGRRVALEWLPTPRDLPAADETLPQAGFVVLTGSRDRTSYAVTESGERYGRCFTLSKSGGKGTDARREAYVIVCDNDGTHGRCECEGFRARGTCRHVDCVESLIYNKWL